MAKAPAPGGVKTRLCPPLSPAFAATLAEAFLRDELATFSRLPGCELRLCYAPAEARPQVESLTAGLSVTLEPQAEGDLGARLLHVFQRADGVPTVVVGGDSPDLSPAWATEAFRVLERETADVVLGPAEDGGYYLVGARRPHPELFRGIPWSGTQVLTVTRERAVEAGLRVRLLPPWRDIDTLDDLLALRERLADAPADVAPRTRTVLQELSVRGGV